MRALRYSLIAALAAATLALSAAVAEESAASRQAPRGSKPRQLLLKYRLDKIAEGTLVATLSHNRQEWETLSPDQRDQFRRDALAFEHKDPQEQEALLKHYEKLIKMSAERRDAYRERAEWLKVVVDSFTPDERQRIQDMPPDERARLILDRKAELIRQGKLKPETRPASAPATTSAPSAPSAL